MTEEQIRQNAEEYFNNDFAKRLPSEVRSEELIKEAYIIGAHSRDEEIEELKSSYHNMFCILANKVEQLRNPWISVEKHPDDITKDYLLEYEDENHIVAMWDSGIWMSKNLHPLKEPTHWMPIPELKKGK